MFKGGSNKTTKAFSGKGHTLSSSSSGVGVASVDMGGASDGRARGVQQPKVGVTKQLTELQSQEKDLQTQVQPFTIPPHPLHTVTLLHTRPHIDTLTLDVHTRAHCLTPHSHCYTTPSPGKGVKSRISGCRACSRGCLGEG